MPTVEDESDLMIAVGDDFFQVLPPNCPRVLAEVVRVLAGELVPSALNVFGREGLTVVPFDALAQREPQLGLPPGCLLPVLSPAFLPTLVISLDAAGTSSGK